VPWVPDPAGAQTNRTQMSAGCDRALNPEETWLWT